MLRRLVGFLIALVAALLSAPMPSGSAAPATPIAPHSHNGHRSSAAETQMAIERGPPAPGYTNTCDAVDDRSCGASARTDAGTPHTATTYDMAPALVQVAHATPTTSEQAPVVDAGHVVFGRPDVAASGAPAAERLFTSRAAGVDLKLLGNCYARGESGLLNRTGSRLKFGWTSSGEFGGGWHLRLGIGRSPLNPNQARFHCDFGSTHVPNSVANDLLDVLRGLNGLQ